MEREFVNVKKLKNLHTLSTIEERREWENIMEKYLTRCGLSDILKVNSFYCLPKVFYQDYAEIRRILLKLFIFLIEFDYESDRKSKRGLTWEVNLEKNIFVDKEAFEIFDVLENYDLYTLFGMI